MMSNGWPATVIYDGIVWFFGRLSYLGHLLRVWIEDFNNLDWVPIPFSHVYAALFFGVSCLSEPARNIVLSHWLQWVP